MMSNCTRNESGVKRPLTGPKDRRLQYASTYSVMVVDLAVVAEPQEGELLDPQRLHAVQLVHDSQPVEAEAAVGVAVDILEAERIRPAVRYLHGTGALDRKAFIAAE